MYISVGDEHVRLVESNDLSTFYLSTVDMSEQDIDMLLRRFGVGVAHSGHAFIDPIWLEEHRGNDADWSAALEGMLASARSMGWIVDGLVQVHIERSQV